MMAIMKKTLPWMIYGAMLIDEWTPPNTFNNDSGNGNNLNNNTKYIALPFTFTFYGQDYNEISVSANGWISFGHSNMESFRNYQLPGAGGPSPMIAAFWDDLKTNSSSKVLKYVTEDYVVIEWLNMKREDFK